MDNETNLSTSEVLNEQPTVTEEQQRVINEANAVGSGEIKPAALAAEGKRRSNSAYAFSLVDGRMVFDYGTIGRLVFDPSKVSATNRARAMMHGLKQRIVDSAALDADASGKVNVAQKYAEMQRVIEHLESGSEEWNLKPSAGTTGPASYVTQALVALASYQGQDTSTAELANAFVKRVADAPKLKLGGEMGKARKWLEANSKVIRDKIAELRAAEAPVVDADAELSALLAG